MLECQIAAPAKINLSLRVVGRRADGYHELDSIFVPLSFADQVDIRCQPAAALTVSCRCPAQPELDGEDNLAARAARAILQRVNVAAAVEISIDKRIWQAAGLGGGSSDAAAVLRAINGALGERALDGTALAQLALELGADVPFFLDPRPARAQGIGERLSPVEGMPQLQLVLANPAVPLSTIEVYRGLGLQPGTRLEPPPQPDRVVPDLDQIAALMINDLEPVATRLCPRIEQLEAALLDSGAVAACMSGSGATVFGLFGEASAARRAAESIAAIPDTYSTYATTRCGLTGAP